MLSSSLRLARRRLALSLPLPPFAPFAPLVAFVVLAAAATGAHAGTPPPLPEVTIGDVTLTEGNSGTKNFNFTVTLSAADAVNDTVIDFATDDVEAVAGSDYVGDTDNITITKGNTSGTITVKVNGDNLDEVDETFIVSLTGVSANAVIGADDIGIGTISNDDTAPVVSINDVSITENATDLTFTLSLNKNAGRVLSVDFATAGGSATSGADFTATSGTATFNPGDDTVTVDVPILEDALDEVTETFTVNLTNAVNVTIATGDGGTGDGTINDDGDTPPVISVLAQSFGEGAGTVGVVVTLDRASGRAITVDFDTTEGSAKDPEDFDDTSGTISFAAGVVSGTGSVDLVQDDIDEGSGESFGFNLSGATGGASISGSNDNANITISDDDDTPVVSITGGSVTESSAGGNGDDVVFTLTLDHASSTDQTVHFATQDGTAIGTTATVNAEDYDIVDDDIDFPAGTVSVDVRIDTNDDTTAEDDEDFTAELSAPSSGLTVSTTAGSAVGLIHDDDADPTIQINTPAAAKVEGNGGVGGSTLQFDVVLSAGSERTVSVNFAAASGTATSGTDFTATSGTVTNGGDESVTTLHVDVPINGDVLDEDNETFTVTLSTPVHTTIVANKTTAVGTINDDDNAPTVSIADASTTEGDSGTTTLSYVVTLSAASGKTITVQAATSDGSARQPGDYTQKTQGFTFNPGTTSQSFDVTVKSDTTLENNETVNAALTAPVNVTLAKNTAVGTIINDDPVPVLSVADATFDPEGNTGQARNLPFTVSLTNPSDQAIFFDFETRDETALAGQDYVAQSSGSGVIAANTTSTVVNVVVGGDALDEPNETLHLHINSVTNATAGDVDGIGTIVDDDNPPTISVVQPLAAATEGNQATSTLRFDVVLSGATGNLATVHVQSVDDTAVANPSGQVGDDDFVAVPDQVLTFAPGETVKHVDVTVKPDILDEADQEQFKIVLTQAQNAAIAVATGIGKINDDDATPVLSIDNVTLNPEGNSGTEPATFTISLSAVSGRDVQVQFTTADGGVTGVPAATAGTDYIAKSGVVLFARGIITQQVVIDVFEDTSEEPDEHFSVQLSNAQNATIAPPAFGDGTVLNDDAGPTTNTRDGLADGFLDGSPYSVTEEAQLSVGSADGVLKNDQDNDGNILFAFIADDVDPLVGDLVLFPDGAFTFAPAVDFAGVVHFTYLASDGTNDSAPQDVVITVVNVNDAPVLDETTFEVHQVEDDTDPDGVLVSDLADDRISDADVVTAGDDIGVAVIGLPAASGGVGGDPGVVELSLDGGTTWTAITIASETQATLVPSTGRLRLVPPQNGNPTADIVVRAWDGHGGAAGTQVAVTTGAAAFFSLDTSILRVIVDPVNDAPVFAGDTPAADVPVVAVEGAVTTIHLEADDVDDAQDALVFTFDDASSVLPPAASPGDAHFDAVAQTFTFTPAFTDAGVFSARFVVTDATGAFDERVVQIDVRFIDDDLDSLPDTWETDVGLDPTTPDSDGDTIGDVDEVGELLPLLDGLGDPVNTDGDPDVDALDLDSDNDGVVDAIEAGDGDIATVPPDSDDDGDDDYRDENSDDDVRDDGEDNCRTVVNDDQADLDGDNVGDACDNDQDGDRLLDQFEPGLGLDPRDPDEDDDGILDGDEIGDPQQPSSSDGDGTLDAFDLDSDGDNVSDAEEAGDAVPNSPPVDTDDDGAPDYQDRDSDDDGVEDDSDNCRVTKNPDQLDIDEDGVGDACLQVCGDGAIQAPEECDDGNADDTDQCDSTCKKICKAELCNGIDDDCDGAVDLVATSGEGGKHSVCEERDIKITGGGLGAGCGCSSGPDGAPVVLCLALLALPALLRRRRLHRSTRAQSGLRSSSPALLLALLALVGAGSMAGAANAADEGLGVQQLWPATGGGDDLIAVEGATVNGHLRPSGGLLLDYGYRTLNVSDSLTGASTSLLEHRLEANVIASISLFDRAQIGLTLPVTLLQAAGSDDVFQAPKLDAVALGDARLDARFSIFGDKKDGGPGLAVAAAVTAPTGNPKQLEGYGFLTIEPELIGGWRFGSRARAFVNLGYLVRPRQELLGLAVGSELTYGVGGAYTALPSLDVLAELDGRVAADPAVAISGATAPLEALVGVRWHLLPGHDITGGGALGVTGGYGTPLFRVFAGYLFTLPDNDAEKARQAQVAAAGDSDKDGVVDGNDKCPEIAEDKDGIQDDDGCPDVDADDDGVPDNVDQCPEVAEDKDGFEDQDGCPDLDKDGDGINDDKDDCVDKPEDRDGVEDADGCPDPDNDGDGKNDVDDKCPNVPAATPDGCPAGSDASAQGAVGGGGGGGGNSSGGNGGNGGASVPLIELPQRIYFKTNGTEVTTEGKRLLEQVAETLKHNNDVRVEVQGHSDAQGGVKANDSLSLRRSQAVIDILVNLGVPRQRFLIAVLADNEPLAPNDTTQGRALNRRVQFRVLPP